MYRQCEYMEKAICNKNLIEIHNELCSLIHKDPVFKSTIFDDALEYLQREGIQDVIETHNKRPFREKDKWTKEYWGMVMSDLMFNFSNERIEHIKEIGKHLFYAETYHEYEVPSASDSRQPGAYSSIEGNGGAPNRSRGDAASNWDEGFGNHDIHILRCVKNGLRATAKISKAFVNGLSSFWK